MDDKYYQNPTFPGKYNDLNTNQTNHNLYDNNALPDDDYSRYNHLKHPQENIPYYNNMDNLLFSDVIKKNKGKMVTIYYTAPDSVEWRDNELSGIIEGAGDNYIILSNPKTGEWFLLLNIFLNYIKFSEPMNYNR